jgi:hypothetical protein
MTTLEKQFPDVHSRLTKQADAEKLFESFMEVMRSPEADYYDGTLDIKLKKLYEDGVEYGF